ncbi:hypothetical protein [Bradyrhizobium cosmicum]|uniref:hypothetical protein n=1 Tax=Bradyrhizobium cosmicum TaxID=1404864 RepID=UPI0028E4FFB2|nr:hypothetical protein [Bradyrhizobium cosmicum]
MFHFLIGLLVVGAIITMMVASPAFRNFVIAALLLIGGGIWLLIENANKDAEQRKKAQQAQEYYAATAIKEADLTLTDVKLGPASYGMSDFVLSGTVANDSNNALATIFFQVTLTDCREVICRVVGQKDASASVSVPPKQLRSFSSYAIRFENLPPVSTAKRSWTYRITGLRAG